MIENLLVSIMSGLLVWLLQEVVRTMDTLTDEQLDAALRELATVNAQRAALETRGKELRATIGPAIAQRDAVTLPGLVRAYITPVRVLRTYNKELIDIVLADMAAEGEARWAQRLARCITEVERPGTLYVVKDKR